MDAALNHFDRTRKATLGLVRDRYRNLLRLAKADAFNPFMEPDFDGDETGEESQLVFRLLNHFKYGMC